jgi:hypothetical protein
VAEKLTPIADAWPPSTCGLPGVYRLNGGAGQSGLVKRPFSEPGSTLESRLHPRRSDPVSDRRAEGAGFILSPLDRPIPPNNIWKRC